MTEESGLNSRLRQNIFLFSTASKKRLWVPPNLLSTEYRGFFLGVKAAWVWSCLPTTSNDEICKYSSSPFYILVNSLFWPHLCVHIFLFSSISFITCFVGHNSFRNSVSSHPLEMSLPFICSIVLVLWEKSQLRPYTFVYYSTLLQPFTDFKNVISAAWILVQLLIFIPQDSLP
jgi:hypothetical protein